MSPLGDNNYDRSFKIGDRRGIFKSESSIYIYVNNRLLLTVLFACSVSSLLDVS